MKKSMKHRINLVVTLALSQLCIEIIGYLLHIPMKKIVIVVLGSTLFELLLYWCSSSFIKKSSSEKVSKIFLLFVRKTSPVILACLLFILGQRIWVHGSNFSLFFTAHSLVVFYSILYLLSLNGIMPVRKGEKNAESSSQSF